MCGYTRGLTLNLSLALHSVSYYTLTCLLSCRRLPSHAAAGSFTQGLCGRTVSCGLGCVWSGPHVEKEDKRCFPPCVSRPILFPGPLRFCSFAHSSKDRNVSCSVWCFTGMCCLNISPDASGRVIYVLPPPQCLHDCWWLIRGKFIFVVYERQPQWVIVLCGPSFNLCYDVDVASELRTVMSGG